jgi:3-oxoacyl-(acyl-carrier-protein) synthase
MGVVSPLGNSVKAFWDGLVSGCSVAKSLKDITHCDLFRLLGENEFASQVITEVEQFEEEAQQLPEQVRRRDRSVQFAVAAALQAVCDARLDGSSSSALHASWGIAFTTAVGAAVATEEAFCQATDCGTEVLDPAMLPDTFYLDWSCHTPALLLASLVNAHGPCTTISSACASGVDVIGHAYESIKDGDASVMLAVASEAPLAPTRFGGCDVIHCLSTGFNGQPKLASRPFDLRRSGFVMGEGAGALMLEEREHALARGAHIYAEITGFGLVSNATHMVSLKPAVAPHLVRAIKQAMSQAGIETVDYIQPHASSTAQNDETETRAIKKAFGEYAYAIPMSATKSMLGHALATAGFFGVMAAALSLERGIIHPTINYEEPDPLCDLDYVPNTARPFDGKSALVIASGFSGSHATLVLQKGREQ